MSVSKPFEENSLHNAAHVLKSSGGISPSPLIPGSGRAAPVLPPRPSSIVSSGYGGNVNSFMPYGGYGGYNSFNSYSSPYRSPYSSYGAFGGYGGYSGGYGGYSSGYPGGGVYGSDDHERRFIQYAEDSSRNTFASVESVVRAFNSLAMMLDNTFFAMTSSFRAVLSVAENFGKLRSMFGQIWYSVNIFRLFNWLYKKLLLLLGYKIPQSSTSVAWKQATGGATGPIPSPSSPGGSSWPTLAFLGMLISAPYIISKFLPKYEDKGDPANWKSPGVRAKSAFDFAATAPGELTIRTNDLVLLAPTYIQEEMQLKNTGWAYAVCKGQSGVVPLNYLVISKNPPILSRPNEEVPIPRPSGHKSHTKRVSFGETQVFEEDYMPKGSAVRVVKGEPETEEVAAAGDGSDSNNNNNSVVDS